MGDTRHGAHAPRDGAPSARLRAPYVCDQCVNDDGTPVVHTPALPFDTPRTGVHYNARTGAWVAWTTHAHAGCVNDGATFIVRDAPAIRYASRPNDVRAAHDTRLASIAGVTRDDTPRTVRVTYWDPWDGTRRAPRVTARWYASDARASGVRAWLRARSDDALRDAPTPHDCPTERRARDNATPRAVGWDTPDAPTPDATPCDRMHRDGVRCPCMDARERRAAHRRAFDAMVRARVRAASTNDACARAMMRASDR